MVKFIEILSKQMKQPTTIEQQIELLEFRNVIIEDKERASNCLKWYNYYFITGYLHPYRNKENNGESYHSISFDKIIKQIHFDMRLREVCMYGLDIIEKSLKTIIAYHFSHNYDCGNVAYLHKNYFPGMEDSHSKFISYYKKAEDNNKDLPFVKHNLDKYGSLPIWAAIELFTMGNIENFFKLLKNDCIKEIEQEFGFPKKKLKNWIKSLRVFRNMVAHNHRLYNFPIPSTPIKAKEYKGQSGKIFDYVVVMKYLFLDKEDWNGYVIPRLEYVFDDFKKDIDLNCVGFPKNWKDILKK